MLAQLIAKPDFQHRLNRLSLEFVGRLILVTAKLGSPGLQPLSRAIAKNLPLRSDDRPSAENEATFEKLSIILSQLAEAGQTTERDLLLVRILETFQIDEFLGERSGKGLAYVLHHLQLAQQAWERSRSASFVRDLLRHDLSKVASQWEPQALERFLWACWRINPDETARWFEEVGVVVVASVLERADTVRAWWILWNALAINPAEARRSLRRARTRLTTLLTSAGPAGLPLVGLGHWLGENLSWDDWPEPSTAAAELIREGSTASRRRPPASSRILLSLVGYASRDRASAAEFFRLVMEGLMDLQASGVLQSSPEEFLTEAHPSLEIREKANAALAEFLHVDGSGS